MSILNSVIKIFVGDKQQKDLKTLQPIVEDVRAFESSLTGLSHDELRNKTVEFKNKIKEATKTFQDQIDALEQEALEADIDRQEQIFREVDTLRDQAYEASEAVLNDIMPEAFAVIKETAKRFVENEEDSILEGPFYWIAVISLIGLLVASIITINQNLRGSKRSLTNCN